MAAVFLSVTPAALGHEESAIEALPVIVEVVPTIDGVEFKALQVTAPTLVGINRTDSWLVMIDEVGDPFLRIGKGRVETNTASAAAYTSIDPTGQRPVPPGLTAGAKPKWVLLERTDVWSWFDPRVEHRQGQTNEWVVTALYEGETITIRGDFELIEGHGHFVTDVTDTPSVEGLEVRLLPGPIPAVFVRNETQRELAVPGQDGEPFLRIGPDGVFGNTRSPSYYLGGNQTIRTVPNSADASAPPRWQRLSEQPFWSWLEYRALLPTSAEHRSNLGAERKAILEWTTPMVLGDQELGLGGRVDWIPPRLPSAATEQPTESGLPGWLIYVGGALVVGLVLVWGRRPQQASAER